MRARIAACRSRTHRGDPSQAVSRASALATSIAAPAPKCGITVLDGFVFIRALTSLRLECLPKRPERPVLARDRHQPVFLDSEQRCGRSILRLVAAPRGTKMAACASAFDRCGGRLHG